MERELLLELSERVGCMYLSDLSFISDIDVIKTELKKFSPQDFSVNQWNDAINYFTGENANFGSASEAKDFLIGAKFIAN